MLQRLPKLLQLLLVFTAVVNLSYHCSAETEVKWTPNEKDKEGGPLPLSMKQRQQLVQLEQAIASSPNPQATLQQVAQANQMDPQDLLRMLERNHADLQESGSYDKLLAGSSGRKSNLIVQLMSSFAVVLMQTARKHPQIFSLVCLSIVLSLYVAWSAPRTGLCLSSSRKFSGLVSKGPTTVWKPPAAFCRERFLDQNRLWSKLPTSSKNSDDDDNDVHFGAVQALWEEVTNNDNNVLQQNYYQWLDRKTLKRVAPDLQHAALGQSTLRLDELDKTGRRSTTTNNRNDTSAGDRATVASISLQHARDLLEEQQLTDFSERLQYYAKSKQRRGILVVPGMGDWNRMGLLPMYVARQPQGEDDHNEVDEEEKEEDSGMESTRRLQLVLTTQPGYHWEGEIHIDIVSLQKDGNNDDEDDPLVALRVALLIPRKQRSIPKSVAQTIVTSLLQSLTSSLRTRTQLSLSRQSQSSAFSQRAHTQAGKRRQSRFQKEQELEEMAADRRRRWQRQNPNAGHYRPSGDRMRSPNNAVYMT